MELLAPLSWIPKCLQKALEFVSRLTCCTVWGIYMPILFFQSEIIFGSKSASLVPISIIESELFFKENQNWIRFLPCKYGLQEIEDIFLGHDNLSWKCISLLSMISDWLEWSLWHGKIFIKVSFSEELILNVSWTEIAPPYALYDKFEMRHGWSN